MLRILFILSLLVNSAVASNWSDPSPWFDIRKQRIQQLLPDAMQRADIDAWLILCRENNNDPLADHIGCENAGSLAVFMFFFADNGFDSIAFSPIGEATALAEMGIVNNVISVPRGESALDVASQFIKSAKFTRIAVNTSSTNAQADGLTHSQHIALEQTLGASLAKRLVSSEELVYQWLAIKLPEEVEIMRQAAELTEKWQREAYATVIPGKTTDADVAQFLKMKMAEHGVTDAWAPDQNPNVNSGQDRGHSHATDKVIMPGDVIQTDFGIRVHHRWVTDIQRFAYVLKPGETDPPENIQHYWQSAVEGRNAAFAAMRPGVRGVDVDSAQRAVMQRTGSEHVMWSTGHPVGYVAHDTGPNLGGSQSPEVRPASQRKLRAGMTFAFDGFHSWLRDDGTFKTISVEDMVVITDDGAEFLIPPQQSLILIPSSE
ncbi:M24 family metallopeptidase [Aestuariibacter salexigens]|uniref:M24 family metallopeptidase n=1 Tax=Aestuariibacter salexigens TaxID=226010 RepID=UPI0004034DDB|nr:M24 family metallopeptidase [Aestuariibacter salexigens]